MSSLQTSFCITHFLFPKKIEPATYEKSYSFSSYLQDHNLVLNGTKALRICLNKYVKEL